MSVPKKGLARKAASKSHSGVELGYLKQGKILGPSLACLRCELVKMYQL